ncbi:PEP-CTERM sorting domain-containing protein [Zemynaea arenosa]|nr:PEP-CTERM sorting domain-containing protein [Massilia arenosa]
MKRFFMTALLGAACACASATPIVGVFTGADAGEGLDLSGTFTHALTMYSPANNTKVGDATFQYYGSAPGVTTAAGNLNVSWYTPDYGTSAADNGLELVMHSLIWSNAANSATGQVLTLTMNDLVVGQTYKFQLMFAEQGFNRGFDVFQDNVKIVDDFSPWKVAGMYNGRQSALITNEFVATSSTLSIGFGGTAAGFSDNNPILSAFTLENVGGAVNVPEPGSLALLLAGAGLLGFARRARRI